MVSTEELAAVPLFASLDEAELNALAPWFEPRSASEDTVLTGEGAHGYSFFVLTRGKAVVSHGDTTVAELGPGDFFGESAIFGDGRRNATVIATSPSEVLVMFGTEFRRLEQEHPAIVERIREVVGRRLPDQGAAGS